DGTTLSGGGSSGGGARPRRMRSQDLINAVPASPFSSSPPIGVGLVPNTTGPAAAAAQQLPAALRNSLLNALSNGQMHSPMINGGGGGGGGGGSLPVINAVGGGPAAQDGLLTAPLTRGTLLAVAEEPEGLPLFQMDDTGGGGDVGGDGARGGSAAK
ncbi:hypothetical protein Vretimale_3983, partial [Volvox reticuliferus]